MAKRSDLRVLRDALKVLAALDGVPHTKRQVARILGCSPRQADRILAGLKALKLVAVVPGTGRRETGKLDSHRAYVSTARVVFSAKR